VGCIHVVLCGILLRGSFVYLLISCCIYVLLCCICIIVEMYVIFFSLALSLWYGVALVSRINKTIGLL